MLPDRTKTEHFDIRRKIVANMTAESWHDVPHIAYMYEPDVTEFMGMVKKLNETPRPHKITINTVMLKAVAEGLIAAPACNAHIEFNSRLVSGTIKRYKEINISVPTIMPDTGAMMTINYRDIGTKSLDGIAQQGATAILEIVPPQVFTVCIGAVQKKPLVVTDDAGRDSIEVRMVLPMCLCFDHRALDFDEIVPFIKRLEAVFAHPEEILKW